jgi:hypothetical protein
MMSRTRLRVMVTLGSLGLDPRSLKAVQMEHTPTLSIW